MPIPEEYAAFHRYYIWANRMRAHLDAIKGNTPKPKTLSDAGPVMIELMMYRSLWYGLLYVVIEGWNRLQRMDRNLKDDLIDTALRKKKYVALLKDFRNGTFHFHPQYTSAKVAALKTCERKQVDSGYRVVAADRSAATCAS